MYIEHYISSHKADNFDLISDILSLDNVHSNMFPKIRKKLNNYSIEFFNQ